MNILADLQFIRKYFYEFTIKNLNSSFVYVQNIVEFNKKGFMTKKLVGKEDLGKIKNNYIEIKLLLLIIFLTPCINFFSYFFCR